MLLFWVCLSRDLDSSHLPWGALQPGTPHYSKIIDEISSRERGLLCLEDGCFCCRLGALDLPGAAAGV
jgi:hypothetical protein